MKVSTVLVGHLRGKILGWAPLLWIGLSALEPHPWGLLCVVIAYLHWHLMLLRTLMLAIAKVAEVMLRGNKQALRSAEKTGFSE